MRRVVTMVCVLLVAASLPLLAGINKGTVAGYYSVEASEYSFPELGSGAKVDVESTIMGLMVKGTSFTNPANQLGYSYDVRVGKTNEYSVDGDEVEDTDDFPLRWDIGVYAAYQHDVSYDTFLEMGAGIQFGSQKETYEDSGDTISMEIFSAYIGGYAEINYALNAMTFLNIGAKALIPIGGTLTLSINSASYETDIEMTGFALAPYVGVSFAY